MHSESGEGEREREGGERGGEEEQGRERVWETEKAKHKRLIIIIILLHYSPHICRQLEVIQVLVDSGAELNTPSCEIACLAAYDSDSKDAVLAWHMAGRNSRRQSINDSAGTIKAVSLDTSVLLVL